MEIVPPCILFSGRTFLFSLICDFLLSGVNYLLWNGTIDNFFSLIRTAPAGSVPSLSITSNPTSSSGRAVPRCIPLSSRQSSSAPVPLTAQLLSTSRYSKYDGIKISSKLYLNFNGKSEPRSQKKKIYLWNICDHIKFGYIFPITKNWFSVFENIKLKEILKL